MYLLKTLGGVSLEQNGIPIEGRATQRRRLALLTYLAAAGDRAINRDQLVALLWPERGAEQARHSLSQILYAIRADVGTDVIIAGIDELRLNPAMVASDISEFDVAIVRGDWLTAIKLYRGSFLDGFFLDEAPDFERWAETRRDRVARDYGRALEAHAEAESAIGNSVNAADCWRRRAEIDPLDARVAAHLMEALAHAGDHAGALRHAAQHADLLRAELDAEPDASVAALAAKLRAESAVPREPSPDATRAAPRESIADAAAGPQPHPTANSATPRSRRHTILRRAAILTGVPVLLLAGFAVNRSHIGRTADPQRVIVLGDILGPDTVLALAVKEALQAELSNTPGVRLVPESRMREARRLMGLGQDGALAPHLLQDLGQRQGAQLVLLGRVTPMGTGAQLHIRVIDPVDGRLLFAVTERPERADDVVKAVARLGQTVRTQLGALPADSSIRPLPMVATTSLAALRNYALARQAVARSRQDEALVFAEAAVAEDSLFPLAHYLAGDLSWFLNAETRSSYHMTRAVELSNRAPLPERLLIRARYQHLVLDQPDSALATWRLLLAARPDNALAYESMTWTLRALGQYREAAAAADSALRYDPEAIGQNVGARMVVLFSVGDTAGARASVRAAGLRWRIFETELGIAMMRGNYTAALSLIDSLAGGVDGRYRHYRRLHVFLARGEADSAAAELRITQASPDQLAMRSLLLHATAIADQPKHREAARAHARSALAMLARADLSPPAVARIAERVVVVAAWTGDVETIDAVSRLLDARDARRGLRSYRIARAVVDASRAFVRKEYRDASDRIGRTLREPYFGRSGSMLVVLSADAAIAAGDTGGARRAYEGLVHYRFPDADGEAWWVVASLAAARLTRLSR